MAHAVTPNDPRYLSRGVPLCVVLVTGGDWNEEDVVVWKGEIDLCGGGLPKLERLGNDVGLFHDPSR